MHSFARHFHKSAGKASAKETKGLVLDMGWSYDPFLFGGKVRELRQRTADLARIAHKS